jgi:hypothetical protein
MEAPPKSNGPRDILLRPDRGALTAGVDSAAMGNTAAV